MAKTKTTATGKKATTKKAQVKGQAVPAVAATETKTELPPVDQEEPNKTAPLTDVPAAEKEANLADLDPAASSVSEAEVETMTVAVIGAGNVVPLAKLIASDSPCVVIPYVKDPAAGEELRYAVRAWVTNYPGCRIVVIGDPEDWFSEEVDFIEASRLSDNPQIDVAHKLLIAIADDRIPERFIWSNDDIYPVTPLHEADLDLLTCNGRLAAKGGEGVYAKNRYRTIQALAAAGLSDWDYSTHTPYVFEKSKLAEVIEEFQADQDGYLVSSLYFNKHFPNVVPVKIDPGKDGNFMCCIYSKNPPVDIMTKAFATRKFININSQSYAAVQPLLQSKFPDKSPFEL